MINQYIDVEVPDEFKREAFSVMSNWSYLSMYLASRNPPAETIGMLMSLELKTKRRPQIVYRLAQRLGSRLREQLHREIEDLLNEGKDSRKLSEATAEEVGSHDKKADKSNRRPRQNSPVADK